MEAPLLHSKPPLIIAAASLLAQGSIFPLLKLVDESTGKELLLLDLILHAARRTELEEVYLCIQKDTDEGKRIREYVSFLKEKKKKRVGKLRIETLELPHCSSELDVLRRLEEGWGSDLARGFFMIPANVVPPSDFIAVWESHKAATKKDSSVIATLLPAQVPPTSHFAIPNQRSIIVANGETSELLTYYRFNGYTLSTLDYKALLPSESRWETPPNSLTVRSDLRLDGVYFGTNDLLRVVRENFDYKTYDDLIDNTIRSDIRLETIYVVTKQLHSFSVSPSSPETVPACVAISQGRQLYEMLRIDALKDNDKIDIKGSRSSWKYNDQTKVVQFETTSIGAGVFIKESLIMECVQIGEAADIQNSIIGNNAKVGSGSILKNVVVMPDVELPANCVLSSGLVIQECIANKHLETLLDCFKRGEEIAPNVVMYQPTELNLFLWNSVPNSDWKQQVKALENDPSRDPDRIFDEMYAAEDGSDDSADSSDGLEDEEFEKEARSMLSSVVGNPEHVKNVVLELRTFRLSSNKPDLAIIKAVMPLIAQWIFEEGHKNPESLERSGLGELLESFSSAEDPNVQPVILEACWKESVAKGRSVADLVGALHALQPYTRQDSALENWAALKGHILLKNKIFIRYKEWLLEDDDSSSSG
eukprot:Protomagalhaensia_sp_Gyna_25__2496@NODE_23_length_7676_cov_49_997512_g16_i0_p2_GENE_NODE_23_length_7676_cov_49_997512_g16_i0NODE_23_length_7676_cov_49_997512_g16_i0_p2_ORF_typecomplete_len648_score125_37Hexapep/PF00132_24/2_2Hexapep/PF00132_24/0_0031Fucokinase/PF07959_12/8e06DUF4954/PF16314_5/0_00055Hexapep_2/PF14602_6/3_8Hexapep_2/PF14602_6/0_72Hexapep_2/PF14602_6/8_7e03_NODE_23_length_7676_cov_49_997512_g16_i013003243